MTNLKSKKFLITEAVVKELPNNDSVDIDKLLPQWWTTGRQEGLRLTEIGDLHFKLAQIEYFDFRLDLDIQNNPNTEWNNFLLECNRKIKCPYYIGVNKVEGKKMPYMRFYDSKIAMMIQLYGTIKEYLNSVKDRR